MGCSPPDYVLVYARLVPLVSDATRHITKFAEHLPKTNLRICATVEDGEDDSDWNFRLAVIW